MATPLVSGYDSDSDSGSGSDAGQQQFVQQPKKPPSQPQPTTLQPKPPTVSVGLGLPPPKNSAYSSLLFKSYDSSAPSSSKMSLPQPMASATTQSSSNSATNRAGKRKHQSKLQIKVDSLSDLDEASDGEELSSDSISQAKKRAKAAMEAHKAKGGHSLFGMLPAPKRPADIAKQQADEAQQPHMTIREGAMKIIEVESTGDQADENDAEESKPANQGRKGNDDFRAMLGLKPSNKPVKSKQPADTKPPERASTAKSSSATTTTISIAPQMSLAPSSASRMETNPIPAEDPTDFFSLSATASTSSNLERVEEAAAPGFLKSMAVSSAPVVELKSKDNAKEEEEGFGPTSYPGWQQDPDGSWVPITPKAHEQYAKWLRTNGEGGSQGATINYDDPSRRMRNNGAGGGGFDVSELARAGLRSEDLVDYRVDTSAQPAPHGSSTLDNVYSSVASQIAASSGSSGGGEGASSKLGKLTNQRARQKGQLTSLLAIAEEKRGELKQKWEMGKSAKSQGRMKYGF
ncbi:hypothetical protein IE53DRAFT_383941 [Violaceomyces palustris]|uniref:Uncharacterized protein n=1 Tax=Violaceomyces palustris TaxID=1673888 RepID=A0ACD0P6C4_9BASI|nr:hypothetical protein IE53DRAFT_383941 [Violaceomyces palustris]